MLRGVVDVISRTRIAGWAIDTETPELPVSLLIEVNGTLLARLAANQDRPDVEAAGIGSGHCGFNFLIPDGLPLSSTQTVNVRQEITGAELNGSPRVLAPPEEMDSAVETQLAAMLGNVETLAAIDQRIAFLGAQLDQLLQRRADLEGGRARRSHQAELQSRWARNLMAPGSAQPEPEPHRALFLDDDFPAPDRDAGSNAALSHLRALQRLGYEISFVATAPRTGKEMDARRAGLQDSGITVCAPPFYATVEEVLRRQAGLFDLIYVHRVDNAARYLALARHYSPSARIVYSVADLHHLRVGRQADLEDRPELRALAERLRLAELMASWSADATITHSTAEASYLENVVPGARVHVIPWAVALRPVSAPFARRHGVGFLGWYGHAPNVAAARALVRDIMPLVWQTEPDLPCYLIGADLPEDLRMARHPNIHPVGHVPDLATIFNRLRLTVAPLHFGAGIKGKVLESLAAGLPCVCSPLAAEGLDLPDRLASLVADGHAAMAATICRLHADAEETAALGGAALAFIESRFSASRIDTLLRAACLPDAE